jgi:hypothetical protein
LGRKKVESVSSFCRAWREAESASKCAARASWGTVPLDPREAWMAGTQACGVSV